MSDSIQIHIIFALMFFLGCSQKPQAPESPSLSKETLQEGFWEDATLILEGEDTAGAYLVMEAIGDLEDSRGIPLLQIGLQREEGIVRGQAARSYAKFPKADPAPLEPLLEDFDLEARLWAAGALAALGKEKGKVLLQEFLKTPEPFLDQTAAIGESEGGRVFRRGYYRSIAGAAMEMANEPGKTEIKKVLQNPYSQARNPAILLLLQLGEKDVIPFFQERMEQKQFSPRMAIYLYALLPKPDSLLPAFALYALGRARNDDEQAVVGAWALAKAGVKDVIPFLEKAAINQEDVDIRFFARWALLSPKLGPPAKNIDPSLFEAPPDSQPSDSQPSDSQPSDSQPSQ